MSYRKITFIDLFAGMGGFRLAFEKYGAKCVFSSEIDKYACETYKLNFNDMPAGDITKIPSSEIPNFDVLCAGFPCQPFSIAGKRKGFEDTRGTLFFEVARIIKDKKPKAFLLENVKGLTNHDNGKTLEIILKTLKELGYETKWDVLNAKDYGVPQNRERWYCIGIRNDIGFNKQITFPGKSYLKYTLKDIIKKVTDPKYKISETCEKNIHLNLAKKRLPTDDFSLAYEIRPSRCQFSTNYISPCLTAKMGTGGNNVPVVISQSRKLTEEECLRIMGYPETYKISQGFHSYKQLGNSVVVPVLTELAEIIIQILKGVE